MPLALVGCDGGGETQVGTGMKEPPPEVQARLKEEEAKMKEIMEKQKANPTPIPEGSNQAPPPGG
jgi:hypothetical protein